MKYKTNKVKGLPKYVVVSHLCEKSDVLVLPGEIEAT